MPSIQPFLIWYFTFTFLNSFLPRKDSSLNLVVFDKNVVDMDGDMLEMNKLKIGLLLLFISSLNKKLHCMPKILHNCQHICV
jgi:hypothetical protein